MSETEAHSQTLVNFFNNLSTYYYHENDLSNMTVALCNSSQVFLQFLLDFFFKNLKSADVECVRREVFDFKDKTSRVDIYIQFYKCKQPYLIEVKINDRNHHFGQYEAAYNIDKSQLGYITNYALSLKGYEIKQWKDFYYFLKAKVQEIDDVVQASMINGYMQYLKSLCSFTEYTTHMNLNNINSLHQFFEIASNILTFSTDSYCVNVESLKTPYSGISLAPYSVLQFHITPNDRRRKKQEFWMELYLFHKGDKPRITIGSHDNWNPRLKSEYLDSIKGKFYKVRQGADEWYGVDYTWFDMSKNDAFLESIDLKYQAKLLSEFFKEVIEECYQQLGK